MACEFLGGRNISTHQIPHKFFQKKNPHKSRLTLKCFVYYAQTKWSNIFNH